MLIHDKKIKFIVGLGNPEPRFRHTRHNIGREFIEYIAETNNLSFTELDSFAFIKIENLSIAYPLVYMNSSGQAVKAAMKKFNFQPEELLVIHDDLETIPGKYKFKEGGSASGHNGLKSIIDHLGAQDFLRLKIGIGRPESRDEEEVSRHVLGKLSPEEQAIMAQVYSDIMNLII